MTVCLRSLLFSHEDAEILRCVLELLLLPLLLRSTIRVIGAEGAAAGTQVKVENR